MFYLFFTGNSFYVIIVMWFQDETFSLEAVMKDAVHHLKRIQKKVLQEVRKSSGGAKPFAKEGLNNNTGLAEENSSIISFQKRADTNHRVPRLRNNRSMVH